MIFLPVHYYADPPLRSRLLYTYSVANARRLLGVDSPEVGLRQLAPFAGYEALPYDSFRRRHSRFYVLTSQTAEFTWLPSRLEEDGVRGVLLSSSGPFDVWFYERPHTD